MGDAPPRSYSTSAAFVAILLFSDSYGQTFLNETLSIKNLSVVASIEGTEQRIRLHQAPGTFVQMSYDAASKATMEQNLRELPFYFRDLRSSRTIEHLVSASGLELQYQIGDGANQLDVRSIHQAFEFRLGDYTGISLAESLARKATEFQTEMKTSEANESDGTISRTYDYVVRAGTGGAMTDQQISVRQYSDDGWGERWPRVQYFFDDELLLEAENSDYDVAEGYQFPRSMRVTYYGFEEPQTWQFAIEQVLFNQALSPDLLGPPELAPGARVLDHRENKTALDIRFSPDLLSLDEFTTQTVSNSLSESETVPAPPAPTDDDPAAMQPPDATLAQNTSAPTPGSRIQYLAIAAAILGSAIVAAIITYARRTKR